MDKARGYLNIEVTYEQAVSKLVQQNPDDIARNSATTFDHENSCFNVFYLDRSYYVHYPSGVVTDTEGKNVFLYLSIIFLHYLNTADGTPLSGNWVTFKELQGGEIYQQAFYKRAQLPFLKAFSQTPEQFIEAARQLGGFQHSFGEYCMVIPVLPRVPLAMVLSPGDEEIAASCTILFDARANSYLPTEDYAHIPGLVIGEMQKRI